MGSLCLEGLCPDCSFKLNFHHQRKEVTKPIKTKPDVEPKSKKSSKRKSDAKESASSDQESSSSDEDDKKKRKKHKKESKAGNEEAKEPSEEQEEAVTAKMSAENNMIILEASDSIWKNKAKLTDQSDIKSTEEQIESYLEDLFF